MITTQLPEPEFNVGDLLIVTADWTDRGITGNVIKRRFTEAQFDDTGHCTRGYWEYQLVQNGRFYSSNQLTRKISIQGI